MDLSLPTGGACAVAGALALKGIDMILNFLTKRQRQDDEFAEKQRRQGDEVAERRDERLQKRVAELECRQDRHAREHAEALQKCLDGHQQCIDEQQELAKQVVALQAKVFGHQPPGKDQGLFS
ncbi:MAG TPA: hypothetical protein VNM34_15040 [Verrucomicrobiae bacterium]|nr:hypothetical protein [Verrucomicrobiae bacterium]